jgi:uncharacterized protein YuzE
MRVEYFEDTDTLQISFNDRVVADTHDLDENTLLEEDAEGRLVTITVEHASERADLGTFLYRTHRSSAA